MAAKSANLYARIEPEVKEQAEGILSALGIPASNAINMFYKQIILHRGLPFEVKIPSARPLDMSNLSEEQINEELEKGYADMKAGQMCIRDRHYAGKPFKFDANRRRRHWFGRRKAGNCRFCSFHSGGIDDSRCRPVQPLYLSLIHI